jgi:hypothetical protein
MFPLNLLILVFWLLVKTKKDTSKDATVKNLSVRKNIVNAISKVLIAQIFANAKSARTPKDQNHAHLSICFMSKNR